MPSLRYKHVALEPRARASKSQPEEGSGRAVSTEKMERRARRVSKDEYVSLETRLKKKKQKNNHFRQKNRIYRDTEKEKKWHIQELGGVYSWDITYACRSGRAYTAQGFCAV